MEKTANITADGNTVASSKDGSQSPAIDSTKWRITGKNADKCLDYTG